MFKIIGYIFQAKRGIEKPDEWVSEVSFGFIQIYFIISFIILGFIMIGLGWLGLHFDSGVFKFFSILFLLALTVDIWLYRKAKKFFNRIGTQSVDYSRKKYQEQKFRIVDIDVSKKS